MVDERDDKKTAIDRAFSDLADEFSESASGAGASLGRSAKFVAGAVEVVVTSPLLIPKAYEQIVNVIKPMIEKETEKIPDDKLIEPPLAIAGPALEGMRFAVDEEEIAEMFAKLLACSMHTDRKSEAHHSFVEIIKQLSPDEAKLIKFLGSRGSWPVVDLRSKGEIGSRVAVSNATNIGDHCEVPQRALVQIYLDNLCRLGVCEMPWGTWLSVDGVYEAIEEEEAMQEIIREIEANGDRAKFDRKLIRLTEYGRAFHRACINEASP